ncbi:unnamed protein product [Alopecurus aequalis]
MNLFYEATENATAGKLSKKIEGWPPTTFSDFTDLPRPAFYFPNKPAEMNAGNFDFHFFALLPAQSEGCVMFADQSVAVTVYDDAAKSPFAMRPADFLKPADSITLSTTNFPKQRGGSTGGKHGVYVMSTFDGSFELYNYRRTSNLSDFDNQWKWQRDMPHVPTEYVPDSRQISRRARGVAISPPFAAAAVDSSTICASTKEGTYAIWPAPCSKGTWTQAARWALPFHGAAEYVPKFRLWFGLEDPKICSQQHRLCAFDLASCLKAEEAPAPLHAWEYLDGMPDGWHLSKRYLVNLGMGKFCIATHCFRVPSDDGGDDVKKGNDALTVLTGVEVVCAGGKGLQMIKHKSRHYSVENRGIHCVL